MADSKDDTLPITPEKVTVYDQNIETSLGLIVDLMKAYAEYPDARDNITENARQFVTNVLQVGHKGLAFPIHYADRLDEKAAGILELTKGHSVASFEPAIPVSELARIRLAFIIDKENGFDEAGDVKEAQVMEYHIVPEEKGHDSPSR